MIDTTGNGIGWYCFHASCKAKGKYEGAKKMDYVTKTFDKSEKKMESSLEILKYQKVLKSVFSSERAMRYLHNNNCWEAWSWNRADIKYDVRQDRVVFLVKNEFSQKYAGAVGRALNKDTLS